MHARPTKSDSKAASSGTDAEGKPQRRKPSRRRRWAFRIIAVTLIPLCALLLLEWGLALGGYGINTALFIKVDSDGDTYTTNPAFMDLFYDAGDVKRPMPIPCQLPARKSANTYRIFVMGGSAPMGHPERAFSFARILRVMLEETYGSAQADGPKFEVINLAMSGINSHVVRQIAKQCSQYEPDAVVVYMGNNEVIGLFGAGNEAGGFTSNLTSIHARTFLRSTRIGQLLNQTARNLRSADQGPPLRRDWDLFLAHAVTAADPRLERVYASYRSNLDDIRRAVLDAGADLLLCTVPANLKNFAPLASKHRAGMTAAQMATWQGLYDRGVALEAAGKYAEAIEQYHAAGVVDDQFADLHFRLGRCYLATRGHDKARLSFSEARDQDTLRFRADSRINSIIAEVAQVQPNQRVKLVDVVETFAQRSEAADRITGDEFLYEHVHLNFNGNYVIARALFERLATILPPEISSRAAATAQAPSQQHCAERLGLTNWQRVNLYAGITDMLMAVPYDRRLNVGEDQRRRRGILEGMRQRLGAFGPAPSDAALLQRAIALSPQDLLLREKLGTLLEKLGDPAGAEEQWRWLVQRVPGEAEWHSSLGAALTSQERYDEAQEEFRRTLELSPNYAPAANSWGAVLFIQGRTDEAIQRYLSALEMNANIPSTHINLGIAFASQGKLDEAVKYFTSGLEIDPTSFLGHGNLATALARQGKYDEAALHYGAALMAQPNDAQLNYQMGEVLRLAGHFDDALVHFRRAVDIMPNWAGALQGLARVLATHPDDSVRNGAEALRLARRAAELTQHNNATVLDTLSLAYAAAGQFDQALATAEAAAQRAEANGALAKAQRIRARMQRYQKQQP
jgi:tetratricopeptide (TPR) repeat protein